jgi:predicted transcriptional regulator
MAKIRAKNITISITPTKFTSLFNKLRGEKPEKEFSEISELRGLLSNEKARILYTLRNSKPSSIYSLSKILKRDFKSVREDILVLEKFGFLKLEKNIKGKRKSLKPVLILDSLIINFEV